MNFAFAAQHRRRVVETEEIRNLPSEEEQDIQNRTKRVIVDLLNSVGGGHSITVDEVTPQTHVVDDLDADSLEVVDIVMGLEEEFDIEISDEDAGDKIGRTIGEISDYIVRRYTNLGSTVPLEPKKSARQIQQT